jgi:hypothetical protein
LATVRHNSFRVGVNSPPDLLSLFTLRLQGVFRNITRL